MISTFKKKPLLRVFTQVSEPSSEELLYLIQRARSSKLEVDKNRKSTDQCTVELYVPNLSERYSPPAVEHREHFLYSCGARWNRNTLWLFLHIQETEQRRGRIVRFRLWVLSCQYKPIESLIFTINHLEPNWIDTWDYYLRIFDTGNFNWNLSSILKWWQ